jgi:hypothetical protein
MAKANSQTGAQIAQELVADTAEWFDITNAKPMVNECVQMSRKLIQSLLKSNLNDVKAKDQSQMLAYVGKTLDQVGRYIQFSDGKPDSRQEITVASLLPHLSEEELVIFDKALIRMEASQIEAIGDKKPLPLH